MLGTAPTLLKTIAALVALAAAPRIACGPGDEDCDPAPLAVRVAAVPPAFLFAAVIAVLPTVATLHLGSGVGPTQLQALLIVPLLAFFTVVFSGPVARPILLVMAWRDVRGVGWQVLWGLLATLPAMAFFAQSMPNQLTWPVAGAILLGGALGGLAASAARDGVEDALLAIGKHMRQWREAPSEADLTLPAEARFLPYGALHLPNPARRG